MMFNGDTLSDDFATFQRDERRIPIRYEWKAIEKGISGRLFGENSEKIGHFGFASFWKQIGNLCLLGIF